MNTQHFPNNNNMQIMEILDEKVQFEGNDYEYPFSTIIKIRLSKYSGYTIKCNVISDGMRKIISFQDVICDVSTYLMIQNKNYETHIKIEKLGISIISDNRIAFTNKDNDYKRQEIIYIIFEDIYLYSKIRVSDSSTKNEFQIKFDNIQIDNQYSLIVPYLIVLKSQTKKKKNSFFNLVMYLEKKSYDKVLSIP